MDERASVWPGLGAEAASRLARLALAGVRREYPNKLDHVMGGSGDVRGPRELHPAFYGCYDWHSAVHGHWLLARVLRSCAGVPEHREIVGALSESLTAANVAVEVGYLARPLSRAFERTYGWAWLLKLHEELGRLAEDGATRELRGLGAAWQGAVEPLARAFAARYAEYLPRLTYPVRTGVHPNTAFGLAFAMDWATWAGDAGLRSLVEARSRSYFAGDEGAPARFEPSGGDFFSPTLMEADLMRRVLGAAEFRAWLSGWLPGLERGEPASLFTPALVSDRSDPQIVHLDGLNLGRAWCMRGVAAAIGSGAGRRALLASSAAHEAASMPFVAGGAYEGDHWLGTFAALCVGGS